MGVNQHIGVSGSARCLLFIMACIREVLVRETVVVFHILFLRICSDTTDNSVFEPRLGWETGCVRVASACV